MDSDPANRALSTANAALYGICHAAVVSLGYSPGLGSIHTGKQLSFVYVIADLYKVDVTIPLAFEEAASDEPELARRVRIACREVFHQSRLLARVARDLDRILDVSGVDDYEDSSLGDAALPGQLWDGASQVAGGINYGEDQDENDGEPQW